MISIYCDNHWYVGNVGWFPTEEEAVDEWNIESLAHAFLDGDITWEEAKAEARSIAKPNAYFPS